MALNNLRRGQLKPGKTIPIVLNNLEGSPVLHCEHLGPENYGFINEMMRGAGAEAVKVAAVSKRSPAEVARVRSANRDIVARHSVRRIEGFFYDDENGLPDKTKPVPSTLAAIQEVVEALPDDIFDDVLAIISDGERYRDAPIASNADDLAKK